MPQRDRPLETPRARCGTRKRSRHAGVKWVAFTVANDGLPGCRRLAEHLAIRLHGGRAGRRTGSWSKVSNWNQVRDGFERAAEALRRRHRLGTFHYFTEAIMGRARSSRWTTSRPRTTTSSSRVSRRARRAGLLRLLLLRGEQGQAEGRRDRPGQGCRLRDAERGDGAVEQVPPRSRARSSSMRSGRRSSAPSWPATSATSSTTRRRSRRSRGSSRSPSGSRRRPATSTCRPSGRTTPRSDLTSTSSIY